MYPLDDTIAAVASAPGGAARGIVRLSGPDVPHCLGAIFRTSDGLELHEPRHPQAVGGLLELTGISAPVPCDVFFWPQGRSYTGQIVAEFHTIGSPPILDALLRSLCAAGARLAERGEFTLRAFLSGRIDLTQAEAVLGVIEAADHRELQVATAQLAGGLAGPLDHLRDLLLELLAHLEAGLDFADEDLPFITIEQLQSRLDEAAEILAQLTAQIESRGTAQTAVRAALFGQPNTGKSSLFNALAHKEQALVSDTPGTTRDWLVAELDLDGRKCQLIDTAGFRRETARESGNISAPDRAAQAAAADQIARAHVRLLCLDATRPLDAWEQAELARKDDLQRIIVCTKSDAVGQGDIPADLLRQLAGKHPMIVTSSVTGQGLEPLRSELRRMALAAETACGEVVAGTAARCRESIQRAGESLRNACDLAQAKSGEEFIAAEIRMALDELGKIIGAVYTDDVLDRIFSRFCVGK